MNFVESLYLCYKGLARTRSIFRNPSYHQPDHTVVSELFNAEVNGVLMNILVRVKSKTFFCVQLRVDDYENVRRYYIGVNRRYENICVSRVFLRFRFGDRKEILRDRLEEFERPFSIDVISGHYILRDRWRNLRDRFGPSKHLKKNTVCVIYSCCTHAPDAGGLHMARRAPGQGTQPGSYKTSITSC